MNKKNKEAVCNEVYFVMMRLQLRKETKDIETKQKKLISIFDSSSLLQYIYLLDTSREEVLPSIGRIILVKMLQNKIELANLDRHSLSRTSHAISNMLLSYR